MDVTVNFKPEGPVQRVGHHVCWMNCALTVGALTLPNRRVVFYLQPVTDRRVARRISRRTGWTFRWDGKIFKFRDGTGA